MWNGVLKTEDRQDKEEKKEKAGEITEWRQWKNSPKMAVDLKQQKSIRAPKVQGLGEGNNVVKKDIKDLVSSRCRYI